MGEVLRMTPAQGSSDNCPNRLKIFLKEKKKATTACVVVVLRVLKVFRVF
jgi:hypothetical protein